MYTSSANIFSFSRSIFFAIWFNSCLRSCVPYKFGGTFASVPLSMPCHLVVPTSVCACPLFPALHVRIDSEDDPFGHMLSPGPLLDLYCLVGAVTHTKRFNRTCSLSLLVSRYLTTVSTKVFIFSLNFSIEYLAASFAPCRITTFSNFTFAVRLWL